MRDNLLLWLLALNRPKKRLIQLLADSVLIILSLLLAMSLRLDGVSFMSRPGIWSDLLKVLVIVIPTSLIVFIRLGFYRAIVRYISSRILRTILAGVMVSAGGLAFAAWITGVTIPRSVPLIYALIVFTLVGGLRFIMRGVFSDRMQSRKRVIIYGAGSSGRQLQMSLARSPEYLPVVFVDDDSALQGLTMSGCPVLSPANLPSIIRDYGAQRLLLAMPSLGRAKRAAILSSLEGLHVQVQTIPGMADLVSGKTQISEITDVPIEDLLGRDPVPPRIDLMGHDIRGRVVMVTGAGGSIGSELCRQILEQGPRRLVLFDLSEYNLYSVDQELQGLAGLQSPKVEVVPMIGSVQNSGRVLSALRDYGVETIYHAAAYKHVPLIEGNVIEGLRNNVFGTRTLAEAAVKAGVSSFILISTDKAVRPTNVMGASKRLAEVVCQVIAMRQSRTRFSIVRFGNVLGSSGSVIPLFRRQIDAGGPITVTDPEITRYFMTIPEAAQLVIQAGAMARGGDVFILDMGEPIRIVDLAVQMARLSGLIPQIVTHDAALPSAQEAAHIQIRFTGLRPGEKLYEELLIGTNVSATEHPRIMTATEIAFSQEELDALLAQLMQQCLDHDVYAIRQTLFNARIGYTPMVGLAPVSPDTQAVAV